MQLDIDLSQFKYTGTRPFSIQDTPNEVDTYYESKKNYKKLMNEYEDEIDELQTLMYAHDRYGFLLVFQAMDAAGKDGTIRRVMSGVNPHGVIVHSFKRPTAEELDHDFLWRTNRKMGARGKITIFNRSYYEEVLVVRVHPKILTQYQRIPPEYIQNPDQVWEERYADINNMESYLYRNGIHVIKFFLNISKEEQRQRFLARIEEPSKNWKFSGGDIEERQYWDKYMVAYEKMINATSTPEAPWYVIPGDDKRNMRLIVCQAVLNHLQQLDMHYPMGEHHAEELQQFRQQLENEA